MCGMVLLLRGLRGHRDSPSLVSSWGFVEAVAYQAVQWTVCSRPESARG